MKNLTTKKNPAPAPVPVLTSFCALIERPLNGGADRVLRVAPATERAELLREALALNAPGLSEGYTVEDCTPLVIRQAGTQRHVREGVTGALVIFLSPEHADEAKRMYLEEGDIETVIEPLTEGVAECYKGLVIREAPRRAPVLVAPSICAHCGGAGGVIVRHMGKPYHEECLPYPMAGGEA